MPATRAVLAMAMAMSAACSGTETGNPAPPRGLCEPSIVLDVTSSASVVLTNVTVNGEASVCGAPDGDTVCKLGDAPGVFTLTVAADGHVSTTVEIEVPAANTRCGYQQVHGDVVLEAEEDQ